MASIDREARWRERREAVRAGVLEHRALVPTEPNGNLPEDVPPATVGDDVAEGGDPEGFQVLGEVLPASTTHITPSRWAGWPDDWDLPLWNGRSRFDALVDTAWTCLDKNSAISSTMPAYRLVDGEVAPPTTWMANPDPNLYSGWIEFARQLFWDFQLGEAFILPTAWDDYGYPARFHVVEPWLVNVEMRAGRRVYNIGSLDVTDEILHIRYKSTTSDARGHGPLEAGQARVIAAGALMRYATNVARTGGVPSSALVVPGELREGQADALLHQWYISRTQHLGLPAVLSGGVDIKTLQFSPRDMALLDFSQFNESRIAVLLNVPPFLVGLPSGGDSLTYSTTESLYDFHWRAGLRPMVAAVLEALSFWVLPPNEKVELNRDEYTRPGFTERATAWSTLHGLEDDTGRVITAAEIREVERLDGHRAPAAITGGT